MGDRDRLVKHLGVAIDIDLVLISAQSIFAAQIDHLLVGRDGFIDLVLLVVNRAEPLKEDGAIIFLVGGIGAIGMGGQVDHVFVDLGSLVITAKNIEQQSFVVACLQRIRILLDGLLNGRQRFFVFALAAKDLADMDRGARILRVGVCKLPIFL